MIKDAFQWIWDKIIELFPFGVMDEWQRGVRLLCGRPVKKWRWAFWRERQVAIITPGPYLKLPFLHRVPEVNVAVRTESVTPVPVTSKDGVPMRLGMNLRFRVSDVPLWLIEVDNPLQTILNEGESVLTLVGAEMDWYDAWDIRTLNKKLTKQMKRRCARWGAELEEAEVNCFVEAKGYQVFGDSGSSPLFNEDA